MASFEVLVIITVRLCGIPERIEPTSLVHELIRGTICHPKKQVCTAGLYIRIRRTSTERRNIAVRIRLANPHIAGIEQRLPAALIVEVATAQ
jgi:hypothetical protein